MIHIKKYNDFSVNELMDWTVLPVDVNRGLTQIYSDVFDYMKNGISSLGKGIFEFKKMISKVIDDINKLDISSRKKIFDSILDFIGDNKPENLENKLKNDNILNRLFKIKPRNESISNEESISEIFTDFFRRRLKPIFEFIWSIKYVIGIFVFIAVQVGVFVAIFALVAFILLILMFVGVDLLDKYEKDKIQKKNAEIVAQNAKILQDWIKNNPSNTVFPTWSEFLHKHKYGDKSHRAPDLSSGEAFVRLSSK